MTNREIISQFNCLKGHEKRKSIILVIRKILKQDKIFSALEKQPLYLCTLIVNGGQRDDK